MEGSEDNMLSGQKFIYWADLRLYFRKQGIFNRLILANIRSERPSRFTKVVVHKVYVNTINAEGAP